MASSDALIEVPLPVRGLNTDSPHGPAGYSNDMFNYVPGESNQLRLRQGFHATAGMDARAALTQAYSGYQHGYGMDVPSGNRKATSDLSTTPSLTGLKDWPSATNHAWNASRAVPIGYAVYGDYALITYMDWSAPALSGPSEPSPFWYQSAGGAIPAAAPPSHWFRTLWVRLAGSSTTSGWLEKDCPWVFNEYFFGIQGKSVVMEDRVIFRTPKMAQYEGQINAGSTNAISGGRLHTWGGLVSPTNPSGTGTTIHWSGTGNFTLGDQAFTLATLSTGVAPVDGALMRPTHATVPTYGHPDVYRLAVRSNNTTTGTPYNLSTVYGKDVPQSVAAWTRPNNPTIAWGMTAPMTNTPVGVDAIEVFQDRLFTMGGSPPNTLEDGLKFTGRRDKRLRWSAESNPDYFPTENSIDLFDTPPGPCTGMQAIGDSMLIHFMTGSMILTGYDEDTFQVQKFHGSHGCVDDRAMTYHEGRIYWLSTDGMWSWTGSGAPQRESSVGPGVGVESWITAKMADGSSPSPGYLAPALGVANNSVLVTVPKNTQTYADGTARGTDDALAFDTKTATWMKWGTDEYSVTTGFRYWNTPYLFISSRDGRTFAACTGGLMLVDRGFRNTAPPDPGLASGGAALSTVTADALFTGDAGGPYTYVTRTVTGTVKLGPLQPLRGSTVRLREIEVDHDTRRAAGAAPSGVLPFAVTVRGDDGTTGESPVPGVLPGELWPQTWAAPELGTYAGSSGQFETRRFGPPSSGSLNPTPLAATRYDLYVSTGRYGIHAGDIRAHRLMGVFVRLSGETRQFRAQRGGG